VAGFEEGKSCGMVYEESGDGGFCGTFAGEGFWESVIIAAANRSSWKVVFVRRKVLLIWTSRREA
jgi:hypothetical protein